MDTGNRSRQTIIATALILGLVLLAACGGGSTPKLLGAVRNPPLDVSSVKLNDVSVDPPKPMTMKAAPGELLLVYFGYTFCPDICPTSMSDISVGLKELPKDLASRVKVAMVTVDPERDTPEALRAYLKHFFEPGVGVPLQASDAAALEAAAETFGVRYEVAKHEQGATEYDVSHSAVTYVIDDTGSVVVEWPFGFDSKNIASDIKTLLED